MNNSLSKISWRLAATGGLYLGLALVAITVLGYLTRDSENRWITGVLEFIALGWFIYHYARQMSYAHGDAGFSILQSLVFTLKMMLFAGVISGIGVCIMQNVVDPAYYEGMMSEALANSGMSEMQIKDAMQYMWATKNPVIMALSGAFSMMLYGGLIGLVVAVFVKRLPSSPQIPQNP